jgi:hypothetical protein
MNPALPMTQGLGADMPPPGLAIMNVGNMLALPGRVFERPEDSKRVSVSTQELFRNVADTLRELVAYAIQKRTANDFRKAVDKVFPKYFEAALGLSLLARTSVARPVLETLTNESFSTMEADFRENGLAAFGAAVRDQAVFTVWTFRKISEICQKIDGTKLAVGLQESDEKIFLHFAYHLMRTRFHLGCLAASMRLHKPLYPDVLTIIIDGLRSAVNSYAWARQALDLRIPSTEPQVTPIEWDDEEQALLSEANQDILAEPA